MNKQTIIGLVIIGAILFGFSYYQNWQQKKFRETQRIEDSIARANAPEPLPPVAPLVDSTGIAAAGVAQPPAADPLGETMAAARRSEEQRFSVANDVATYEFSTLGGIIADVVLKDYKKYGGDDLHMWKPGAEQFDVAFFIKHGFRDAQVNTRNFNFTADIPSAEWSEGEESKKVRMRLPVDSLRYLDFVYTIPRDDYMIRFEVDFAGMGDLMSNQSSFDVDWGNISLQNEKGFDNENNYTTLSYRYPDKKGLEDFGIVRAGGTKEENEPNRVHWVAFKQQFFSSIFIADDAFQGADMAVSTFDPKREVGVVKKFHTKAGVPMESGKTSYGFRMYLGPNKFSQLKKYDIGMERIISLGWMSFGWVTRGLVIPMFNLLGSWGLTIGWIILIMAIVIKLIIFPLTFTSYRSSAKMRVIKPEIDEINARFPDKDDAMKKQQATMELYKRAGINPLAGCIPMLIQFPIIIAVFRFFPVAIELRGQSLWWADDLSSYDSIVNLGFKIPWYGDHISLFALLMAVSMFFYSWLNFKQQSAQPQMAGMKFMMLYLMPAMMLLWFNNYSAGLCYYYLLGNLLTIGQMYGVRFAINEDKLRRRMLETPRKEKKKSGFMQRLEEAQKAQIAARAQQQKAQSRGGATAPPVSRGPRGNAPGTGKKKK